jgi:hypothetical protein
MIPGRSCRKTSADTLNTQSHEISGDKHNRICDRGLDTARCRFEYLREERTKLWPQATITWPQSPDNFCQDDEISSD